MTPLVCVETLVGRAGPRNENHPGQKDLQSASLVEGLQHLAALLGEVLTRFGAGGHLFVGRRGPAARGTVLAGLRTAFQHMAGEWSFAGAEGRTRLTRLAAIGA